MVFAGATVVCCAAAGGKGNGFRCGRGLAERVARERSVYFLSLPGRSNIHLLRVGHEEPQKEQAEHLGGTEKSKVSIVAVEERPVAVRGDRNGLPAVPFQTGT